MHAAHSCFDILQQSHVFTGDIAGLIAGLLATCQQTLPSPKNHSCTTRHAQSKKRAQERSSAANRMPLFSMFTQASLPGSLCEGTRTHTKLWSCQGTSCTSCTGPKTCDFGRVPMNRPKGGRASYSLQVILLLCGLLKHQSPRLGCIELFQDHLGSGIASVRCMSGVY